jgi:hypothetical protein
MISSAPHAASRLGRNNRARVYALVARYCRYGDGSCRLPLRALARGLDLAAGTVLRHLRLLAQDGYLQDDPPRNRHHSHTWAVTGKPLPAQPPPERTESASDE